MIRVQQEAFDPTLELAALRRGHQFMGATVMFIGSVREWSEGQNISAMTLEHYPGMTEKALAEIEAEALRRWPIETSLIIHRYGRLQPGDDIVLVITASAHRAAAFDACSFLMDWLKTKAPFWKLEEGSAGSNWVAAKRSDDEATARWNEVKP
jgi:molybdopterin synthase catalytic subunit